MDPHLSAGQAYDEEIQHRLYEADAVVVLWSRSSAGSRWVKAEADVGMDRDVLVSARLDDTDVPLPFHRLQTADLTGWKGAADDPGMVEISNAITRLESGEAPVPPPKPRPPEREPRWRWWWLAAPAGVVLLLAGIFVLSQGVSSGDDEAAEPTGSFVMPNVIGMRLDTARLELAKVNIHGPSELDTNGDQFDAGGRDIEVFTRVVQTSPGPGVEATHETADLMVVLEFCEGVCPVDAPTSTVRRREPGTRSWRPPGPHQPHLPLVPARQQPRHPWSTGSATALGSFLEQSGCRIRCACQADHLHR